MDAPARAGMCGRAQFVRARLARIWPSARAGSVHACGGQTRQRSARQGVTNYFSDPTQQFFAGRWSSTPGTWRVRYTESELCVMTAGRVIIKSDDGASSSFAAGDAFVIPAGFSGTWTVLEDCTKIYAIFESRT